VLVDDVVIEFHGKTYRLPVLLVGSAQTKLKDHMLADRLEAAIDGRIPSVVLDTGDAETFYAAARSISVSLDRENLDWQRLLAELQTVPARDRRVSRSQILAAHKP
jgi:hypothetical protein